MYYIKKNGKYLASETIITEDDYWSPADTDAALHTRWILTDDIEKAKEYYDDRDARYFLTRNRDEFFKGAKVENK